MSNRTLLDRANQILNEVRSGATTVEHASRALRGVTAAFEMLPYSLIKQLESLGHDLEIAAWHEEEDTLSDLEQVLARIDECLARVPAEP